MKIVIVHGQNHKGSTYHIARELAEKVSAVESEITEFFLPRDFDSFCVGCANCFMRGEEKCPHYNALLPITSAMDAADLIILESPVYVYHASGSMKAFLDHYGYRWMVHRPDAAMFRKQAVVLSTAAGAGMKSTNKDMADSLFFWGVAKIYSYGKAVAAVDWNGVSEKNKAKIDKKTSSLAKKILSRATRGAVKPGLKTKAFFFLMHLMQRNGFNQLDVDYWKKNGWTEKKRPWRT